MSNGFTADPDALLTQAAQFPDLADRVSSVHGILTDALSESGSCWGDDAVGQSFAAAHLPAANGTLDQLRQLPGQLGAVGDKFTATAVNYQQVEQRNTDSLTPNN